MAANAGYCHSPRSVTSFPDGKTHSRETYPNHLQQRAARRRAAPRGAKGISWSQLRGIPLDPPGAQELAIHLRLVAPREGERSHLIPNGGRLCWTSQRLGNWQHIYAWQRPGEARGFIWSEWRRCPVWTPDTFTPGSTQGRREV